MQCQTSNSEETLVNEGLSFSELGSHYTYLWSPPCFVCACDLVTRHEWFLDPSASPGGLVEIQIDGFHEGVSDSVGLEGAQEFAFCAEFQEVLMLLAREPHAENC